MEPQKSTKSEEEQIKETMAIEKKFYEMLKESQKPMDPEIQKVINERFWDLIDGEDKQQE